MKYWNSRVSISKQHAYTEPSIIDTEATYIYNFVVDNIWYHLRGSNVPY